MLRRNLVFAVFAVCVLFGVSGCFNSSSGENYPEVVLTHFGFDFSAGVMDTVDYQNNDGEVIAWPPGGGTNPDYTGQQYMWWRNTSVTPTMINATRDMGAVDLASVNRVPDQWDTTPNIPPLIVGHVVVAQCHDGYAKFKVLGTDTLTWTARVEYAFNTSTTFND